MNICKDCQHCPFTSGPSDLWRCLSPSNGTNPQTGCPRWVYADRKNPSGECEYFEQRDPRKDRRPPPTPATLPPPQPRYRSPLWVRVLRWLVQEDAT